MWSNETLSAPILSTRSFLTSSSRVWVFCILSDNFFFDFAILSCKPWVSKLALTTAEAVLEPELEPVLAPECMVDHKISTSFWLVDIRISTDVELTLETFVLTVEVGEGAFV